MPSLRVAIKVTEGICFLNIKPFKMSTQQKIDHYYEVLEIKKHFDNIIITALTQQVKDLKIGLEDRDATVYKAEDAGYNWAKKEVISLLEKYK